MIGQAFEVDGTAVLVSSIAAFSTVGVAGLTILGKWLDRKLDQKADNMLVRNTAEHDETKETLLRVVDGQTRIESKIDNHLEYHAHHSPEHPKLVVVQGSNVTEG